jgi:hypothetical protein
VTSVELHIAIDQELQSKTFGGTLVLQPEEKDLWLNNFIDIYIGKQIEPRSNSIARGFQESVIRLDNIKNLVVRDYELPCYVHDEVTLKAQLPWDYNHYVESVSVVKYRCGQAAGYTTEPTSLHYFIIEIKDYGNDYANFTVKYTLEGEEEETLITFNDTAYEDGITYTSTGMFLLAQYIVELINSQNIEGIVAYYENYMTISQSNSIIVTIPDTASITVCTGEDEDLEQDTFSSDVLVLNVLDSSGNLEKLAANRLIRDDISKISQGLTYTKTRVKMPTVTIANNLIYADIDNFLIETIKLDYIKKHPQFNYMTNQGSLLTRKGSMELIRMVADHIRSIRGVNTVQLAKADNIKNEQ